MARVLLPVIPETPRCPCCSAPVDANGKFSRYPWLAGPGFATTGVAGDAVDPLPEDGGAE